MDKLKDDSISSVLSDVKSEQKRKSDSSKHVDDETCIAEAKNLISTCILALIDNEDDVDITATKTAHLIIFEVKVKKDDLGKVVGKSGANASAIRRLLHCLGAKQKRQYRLEVVG